MKDYLPFEWQEGKEVVMKQELLRQGMRMVLVLMAAVVMLISPEIPSLAEKVM